jgi:hypothetical protein
MLFTLFCGSLYHSIKTVYGPLLEAKSTEKDGAPALDSKLHGLILQLQAGLGAAVRRGTGEQVGAVLWDKQKEEILT